MEVVWIVVSMPFWFFGLGCTCLGAEDLRVGFRDRDGEIIVCSLVVLALGAVALPLAAKIMV